MTDNPLYVNQSNFKVIVEKKDGNIQAINPITAKNQIQEIHTIDDLGLILTNRVNGSTVVWNGNTNQYEVKSVFYPLSNPYQFVNSSFGVISSANNSLFLNGKSEINLNVNNAIIANSALFLAGKSELSLNVNNAITSNNALFLGGKSEGALNVNNALIANGALFLAGKLEGSLNVNNALTAITANTSLFFNGVIDCGTY